MASRGTVPALAATAFSLSLILGTYAWRERPRARESSKAPKDPCRDAMAGQDYALAAKRCGEAAAAGSPAAQFFLGRLYFDGHGVARNPAAAFGWYRKAARQGLAAAQNDLGTLYLKGLGVQRDYLMAAHWFRKAAGQGNAYGEYNLGYLYDKGLGVPKDYGAARVWTMKASLKGVPSKKGGSEGL